MHARTTLSGTEAMLNNFFDERKSLADSWTFDNNEIENFDPNVLLGTIMLKGSDLQPVFTDPQKFYFMTSIWWNKWKPTFEKWAYVLEQEYEPLWDRDGYEEVADHTDDVGTLDTNTTGKETVDDDTSGHVNTENKVSAFDSNTYQPHDTSSTSTTGTDDRTTNTTGTVDTDTTGTRDFSHHLHSYGNWGISQTVQKLKKQELDIQYWNLYEHISDIFLDEMTVRVF